MAEEARRYVAMRPKEGRHQWVIVEPHEVADMMDCVDPCEWEVEDRTMTPAEFNALGEFNGW
jgi:hypothetical protein